MLFIHWWLTAAYDSTPPRAEADGFGSLAAASVPLEMLDALVVSVEQLGAEFDRSPQAGCEDAGTPAVEMVLIH